MNILTINQNNFLKGMSLSDYSADKGFSPLSRGFEVDRSSQLGLLLPGRSLTDYSTGLSGNIITSCKYNAASTTPLYCLVTDSSNIYSTTLISPTHTLKDTATGKTFSANSSAYFYKNGLYITSSTDIYYDDTTFTVKDKTWWTTTKGRTALTSGVPHKIFEFNGVMYILNGNVIASWDGTTATDAAFTLPTGWIITDAEIDNDVIYLTAVKRVIDYSYYTETKIFVWNGISAINWLREVAVFTPGISAIKKVDQGFVFWAGKDMYFFDGYNYQWIRYVSQTPNFNQVAALNGNIYFSTYNGIASYNTRLKIFTHPVLCADTINAINVSYLDYIDIFSTLVSTSKMYRCSVNNYSGSVFYSNRYFLGNVRVRKIVYAFNSALATNSSYAVNILDESDASVYSNTISKALDGAKTLVVRNNLNVKLNTLQLKVSFDNAANSAIRFIQIFYEPSENYVGK